MRFFGPRQALASRSVHRSFSMTSLAFSVRKHSSKAIQWNDVIGARNAPPPLPPVIDAPRNLPPESYWAKKSFSELLAAERYYEKENHTIKLYLEDEQFKKAREKGYLPALEIYTNFSLSGRQQIARFLNSPNGMTALDQNCLTLPEYIFVLSCEIQSCLVHDTLAADILNSNFFHVFIETKKIVIRDLITDDKDKTAENFNKLRKLKDAFLAKNTEEAIKRGYITADTMLSLDESQLYHLRTLMNRGEAPQFTRIHEDPKHSITIFDLIDQPIFSLEAVLKLDKKLREGYVQHVYNYCKPVSIEKFYSLRLNTQSRLQLRREFDPLSGMTLDEFDRLSDIDQDDLCEIQGKYGILNLYFPLSAFLALSHDERRLFHVLSRSQDSYDALDQRLINKFLAKLGLHKPEKLAEFKALTNIEKYACFNHLKIYADDWNKAGKGDLPHEAIIPEKSYGIKKTGKRGYEFARPNDLLEEAKCARKDRRFPLACLGLAAGGFFMYRKFQAAFPLAQTMHNLEEDATSKNKPSVFGLTQ